MSPDDLCYTSASALAAQVPDALEGKALGDSSSHRIALKGARPTLVVFLSARCPCSASHEPALAELHKEFGGEVRFVGVHSNADETPDESVTHFRSAALPFPVIQDSGAKLANAFGVNQNQTGAKMRLQSFEEFMKTRNVKDAL